ncbi:DDE-type integrase/transposase/recombinase [Vibrio algarum]|uniref:DDE-type integrase/transposase/recombinase n=1 Tax=Vibrio algarum TaxID=3020714 RepID=A0ABT4YVA7_9VIBR|nr:DDE-type integrase/transposase/recombinase [Vibrio sp. KJ40-1]MDB1125463.1 DDE-type integrase/transposase/recombinase [Vibrio sp. KJ40-1]
MDELFINIRGEHHYLWRAVEKDGDVIDILGQKRRDGKAAKRFFNRLLTRNQGVRPWKIVTDPHWLGDGAVIMLLKGCLFEIHFTTTASTTIIGVKVLMNQQGLESGKCENSKAGHMRNVFSVISLQRITSLIDKDTCIVPNFTKVEDRMLLLHGP